MPKTLSTVKLPPDHCRELELLVTRGKKSAREITRARILLRTQDGQRVTKIAQPLGVSRGTIYNTYQRSQPKKARGPLVAVLQEEPRSGRPLKLDARVAARVTLIACSDPPAGRARWTLQLIADRLVTLGVTDAISHESVRQLLKKTASSPG